VERENIQFDSHNLLKIKHSATQSCYNTIIFFFRTIFSPEKENDGEKEGKYTCYRIIEGEG
jgi:hypothetical protein